MSSTSYWSDVADELRNIPLFIDPAVAAQIEPADRDAIDDALSGTETPVYVAIVPADAGDARSSGELRDAMGSDGTFLVLFEDGNISAGSTLFSGGDELSQAVFAENNGLREGTLAYIEAADEHVADSKTLRERHTRYRVPLYQQADC